MTFDLNLNTQINKYKYTNTNVQAGKYTPEAACEHPEAVRQLALEFARAGGDVTQTFTYGSTEGEMNMMMMVMMATFTCNSTEGSNIIYVDWNNKIFGETTQFTYDVRNSKKLFRDAGGMSLHPRANQPGSL